MGAENKKEGKKRAVRADKGDAAVCTLDRGCWVQGRKSGVGLKLEKQVLGEPLKCRLQVCCVGTECQDALSGFSHNAGLAP